METLKSVRVGEGCWRALKQLALNEDTTIRELVERLVLGSSEKKVVVKVPEPPVAELRVDEEARCVCGQRLRDHQGGSSKRLAVATNCRNFREV